MSEIWNDILQSNLFNFVLMLFVLAWIFKKFNIADKLEQGRKNIEDRIILSNLEKEKSIKNLYAAQAETENINKKVFEILDKSEKNALITGQKLVNDAIEQAKTFNDTVEKTEETETKTLKNSLTEKTARAAIKLARNRVETELKNNRDLHMKFINESIDALKGVEL